MTVAWDGDDLIFLPGTKLMFSQAPKNVHISLKPPNNNDSLPTHTVDVLSKECVMAHCTEPSKWTCTNQKCKKVMECNEYKYRIVSKVILSKGMRTEYVHGTYCSFHCLRSDIEEQFTKIDIYRNKWICEPSSLSYTKRKLIKDGKMNWGDTLVK